MVEKIKKGILNQITNILRDYNELKATFEPLKYPGVLGKDATEIAKINGLITKAKVLISSNFGEDSIYFKQVDLHSNGRKDMSGRNELNIVMTDLKMIHDDIIQNCLQILEEEKTNSLKFDKIIEETNITDRAYEEVIKEINGTYKDHHFASMYIMIRKLLENLLYDCLKKYYDTDVDKYYNTIKGQHQGFGTLIANFNDMIKETRFKKDIGDVEQQSIDLLKQFQEKGNKDAHSLFNLAHQDFIEERKDKINNLIKKLDWVMQKL